MTPRPTERVPVQSELLFRDAQIRQLTRLLGPTTPSPPTIVAYGPRDTGKSSVIRSVLEKVEAIHAIVDCSQCISFRHLLVKAYATCLAALGHAVDWELDGKCDSLNALAVNLNAALQGRGENLFLVCDSIDRQRECASSLVAALARLGQVVKNLTIVLVTRSIQKTAFHGQGVPYVRFPNFSRDEAISIIARRGPPSSSLGSLSDSAEKWYPHFVTAVYESLIEPTTRSLPLLGETCEKLWPRFIQPFVDGEKPPGRSKTWDFSKLLVRNRALIQVEAEQGSNAHLIDQNGQTAPSESGNNITEKNDDEEASSGRDATRSQSSAAVKMPKPLLLRYFSALVLVAAYLASHSSPKLDILLFSRLSSSNRKVKKSYQRRKLFQSPTKPGVTTSHSSAVTKTSSVAVLHKTLVRSFSLDRLISIVRAIHPRGIPRRRSLADKVTSELAELVRLRLVNLMAGDWGVDERLTVNVSKAWMEDVALRWSIDWKDFVI